MSVYLLVENRSRGRKETFPASPEPRTDPGRLLRRMLVASRNIAWLPADSLPVVYPTTEIHETILLPVNWCSVWH